MKRLDSLLASAPPDAPILIAGATASGKSSLALRLARRTGGAIVNADSMQVYREWRILTARPKAEEIARAPHHLYGFVSVQESFSLGRWHGEVKETLRTLASEKRRAILVGGTGLYFHAVTCGLAAIPQIPPDMRADAQTLLETIGCSGLFRRLRACDPDTATRIDASNPVRLRRAWEVWQATGVGLAEWQRRTKPPILPLFRAVPLLLRREREALHRRIDTRLARMVAEGAVGEAASVMAHAMPPDAPARKILGARAFARAARGEIALESAIAQTALETRQYAKRQETWFRNRMRDWHRITHDGE